MVIEPVKSDSGELTWKPFGELTVVSFLNHNFMQMIVNRVQVTYKLVISNALPN